MIIDKPFKTYYQQLRILRSRNLLIPNGSRAVKILKRENYYNIINGYKDIFLDSNYSTDFYKPGTSFDDIYALYCFDRDLRSILLKYILRMETSLKTKIAYRFSERYPSYK
jgi:abortive infection bacteriophage resistance protein